MKRSLLPLNALRVFDAAARHLSFTRAADELAVTPAAVGQQIRALEDVLGVILFRRTSRGLELTTEAANGLTALRQGFGLFEDAVQAMRAGQTSNAISIAAPRDFTAIWLAPRLARIVRENADLRVTLIAADEMVSFTDANLDVAVMRAEALPDLESVALTDASMVCIRAIGSDTEAQITWPGVGTDAAAALHCSDAGSAIAAARAGLGIAKVPLCLVETELAAGTIAILGEPESGEKSYWLAAPAPQWRQKKVQSLISALLAG